MSNEHPGGRSRPRGVITDYRASTAISVWQATGQTWPDLTWLTCPWTDTDITWHWHSLTGSDPDLTWPGFSGYIWIKSGWGQGQIWVWSGQVMSVSVMWAKYMYMRQQQLYVYALTRALEGVWESHRLEGGHIMPPSISAPMRANATNFGGYLGPHYNFFWPKFWDRGSTS